jgi:hypothetical protein
MSTKRKGISCYEKAGVDEELFVLRAQDSTAPATVIDWISRNILSATDQKLRDAMEVALRMRKQSGRKMPD